MGGPTCTLSSPDCRPAAAMYVLPMFLIFSTSASSGSRSSCKDGIDYRVYTSNTTEPWRICDSRIYNLMISGNLNTFYTPKQVDHPSNRLF